MKMLVAGLGLAVVLAGGVAAWYLLGNSTPDSGSAVKSPAGEVLAPSVPEPTGPNIIMGTDGDDELKGTSGDDEIHGGDGDDRLQGFGGNDQLFGGLGNDILFGGAGNDRLEGGGGRDRLEGGSGDDVLKGGGNRDLFTFVGEWGNDTVEDFSPTVDILDFTRLGLKAEGETDADAFAKLSVQADGDDTVIRVIGDTANSVRLLGLVPDQVHAERFRF